MTKKWVGVVLVVSVLMLIFLYADSDKSNANEIRQAWGLERTEGEPVNPGRYIGKYWTRPRADYMIEKRHLVFSRPVLAAECEGIGDNTVKRKGRTYWRKFDCVIDHPGAFRTYAILATKTKNTYQLLVYGGIG